MNIIVANKKKGPVHMEESAGRPLFVCHNRYEESGFLPKSNFR